MKAIKKNIAKQIGGQIKKILEKNFDSIDPQAANFAKKYAEYLALCAMGEKSVNKRRSPTTIPKISSKKNKKFKIKINGMSKVVKDVMRGESVEKAVKANAGIFASFSFKW